MYAWYKDFDGNVEPVWNSPEYFLINVNGVSQEAIKKNENKYQINADKQSLGFVGDSVK